MALETFMAIILIAFVCSALARSAMGFAASSWLWSMVAATVGAVMATWLTESMLLPRAYSVRIGGESVPVAWAAAGAFLFAIMVEMMGRPEPRR